MPRYPKTTLAPFLLALPAATEEIRSALLLMALLLAGCQTTRTTVTDRPETAGNWACLAFQPIRWSSRDTKETLDQIAEHNAVWEALCGES